MRHDYKRAVSEALMQISVDACGDDPASVEALSDALREYAESLDRTRKSMIIEPRYTCCDCGRDWTAKMTVERERNCRPDNCPDCYNRTAKEQSGWTSTFRYM